ncbi:MAG: oligosaccharide flippase family protein, partial [Bacteroidota bacterium]
MAVDSENRQDVADLMKKSGIGSVGQFIAIVLRYGATLIMTNILGAAPYGLFVLGRTVALFGGLLSTVGMGPAVRKQIPTYLVKGDHDRIRLSIRFSLLLTLSCSLGTMVLLFLLAPTLAYHAFDNPDLVPVIRLFAFVVPLTSVLDIYLDIFKGYKQIAAFVWVKNLALPGLNILFLLLAGWTGGSVTSFILAFVGAHVASLLLSIVLRKKHPAAVVEPAAAPAEANTEPVKEEMLRFGLPLFFTSALDYVQRWTDTVMLAWLLGMTATGIYGVSLRMAAFVALPLMAMNLIFSPLIAEVHARNDIERLRFNYQFVTKMVFSVSLFIFAIIFLFPHELLSMFGK